MNLMYNPLISIIVTSYNYGQFIEQTLESLSKQTYKNFEVIVIDDGSSDNSLEIIKKYENIDSRIKLYQHPDSKNHGLAESVELGVKVARGDYIAFCESDDYLALNYLERKVSYINMFPNVDIIANYPRMFGDKNLVEFKTLEFRPLFDTLRRIKKPKKIYFDLLNANEMVFSTFSIVMVRSKCIKKCNFSPINYSTAIDIWLWKQLLVKYKVGYIDEELTNWRLHKKSVTQQYQIDDWRQYYNELNKILQFSFSDKLHLFIRKFIKLYWTPKGLFLEIGKLKTYILRINKDEKSKY